MFTVYRAFGPHSTLSYYGYSQGENVLEAFIAGGTRTETERADVRLINANNGDSTCIQIEVIDVFEDEMDAFIVRNEQRALHSDSISGPTYFPGGIAERAAREKPESIEGWKKRMEMKGAKTARQAYALGMWTKEQIITLGKVFSRSEIVNALDKLTPVEFDLKYKEYII